MDTQVADLAAWLLVIVAVALVAFVLYRVARWLSPVVVGILVALGVVE